MLEHQGQSIRIRLKRNEGFVWSKHEVDGKVFFFKGFLFDSNNRLFNSENILEYVSGINNEHDFTVKITAANGSFALIAILNARELFAATDRVRSIPLYYTSQSGGVSLCDEACTLLTYEGFDNKVSKLAHDEFALAGFVVDNLTLHPDIYEISAGDYITYKNNEFLHKTWFLHLHENFIKSNDAYHFSRLAEISRSVCNRLLSSINEKQTIVLPLSGGYDSRYLACMLKEANAKDVICYTYGKPDSHEVLRARQVSMALGFKWLFVEYTPEKIVKTLASLRWEKYCEYCGDYASLPHIQDYIALYELTESGHLPEKAVIVPGYCGDLLGGSYVPIDVALGNEQYLLRKGLPSYIAEKHLARFALFEHEYPYARILQHIDASLKKMNAEVSDVESFVSYHEAFVMRHRVAKFIINSLRAYEFFGFEWRIPLMDHELLDYWYRIPVSDRIGDKLYERFLFSCYFEPMGVANKRAMEGHRARLLYQFLHKSFLPPLLAHKVVSSGRKIYRQFNKKNKHFNGFDVFENAYRQEMSQAGMTSFRSDTVNVNAVLSRWWLWKKFDSSNALHPVSDV